jgi:hypothetical protein
MSDKLNYKAAFGATAITTKQPSVRRAAIGLKPPSLHQGVQPNLGRIGLALR